MIFLLISTLVEINSTGSKNYFLSDHLGSTSVLVNSTGKLIEKTRYDPFGSELAGGNKSKYGYNGKEEDVTTGLLYYGARYYNPRLKRWTQPDPMIQDIYDPQSLNRYSYVKNNPMKYTDPDGFVAVQLGVSGSGGLGAGAGGGVGLVITHDDEHGFQFGVYFDIGAGGCIGGGVSGDVEGTLTPSANTVEDIGGISDTISASGHYPGIGGVMGGISAPDKSSELLSYDPDYSDLSKLGYTFGVGEGADVDIQEFKTNTLTWTLWRERTETNPITKIQPQSASNAQNNPQKTLTNTYAGGGSITSEPSMGTKPYVQKIEYPNSLQNSFIKSTEQKCNTPINGQGIYFYLPSIDYYNR